MSNSNYAYENSQFFSFFINNQVCTYSSSVLCTQFSFSDSKMMNLILLNDWSDKSQVLDTNNICKNSQSKSIQTDSNFIIKVVVENTVVL